MLTPGTKIRKASLKLSCKLLFMLLAISPLCVSAHAFEFLPEIDTYHNINSIVRLDFQAKETREAGDPTQAEIGPSLDFCVKPLVGLQTIPVF